MPLLWSYYALCFGAKDVKFAGWRDQLLTDDGLHLAHLVVDHNDHRFLVVAFPDRKPDFVTSIVELRLGSALGIIFVTGAFADGIGSWILPR